MKKLLRLPSYVHLEYKVHRDSLTDGSSFGNTSVWRPSHAPRGASWNGVGTEPAAEGTHGYNKSRSHTAQPPGGVTGDGAAWGGGAAKHSNPHHQGGGGGWKNNNLSTNTSHNVAAGPAMISPTLGGALAAGGEKPVNFWGKPRDGTTGGSSWGRTNAAAAAPAPAAGSFQHKGPDDERGGNYGDVEGRNPRTSRYPPNAPAGEGAEGASAYQGRRRFDPAGGAGAGQPADGQVSIEQKKRIMPTTNQADQVRVWGRAKIVSADAAPLPAGEPPASS
jgi:hypothetical protein